MSYEWEQLFDESVGNCKWEGLAFSAFFGPTLCLRAQVVLGASLKMPFRIFANSRGSAGLYFAGAVSSGLQ